MKPTIGRLVHYQRGHGNTGKLGSATCAALITGVNPDGTVNLHIFPDHGGSDTWIGSIAHAEKPAYGCWNWPPREPQDNRPVPINESPKALAMPLPMAQEDHSGDL
jgi:hypothetical protein